MKTEDLKHGIIIEGPLWDGPVTLEQFREVGNKIKLTIRRVDGSTSTIRTKLEDIRVHHTPHGTPWRVRAAVDMLRHKHAQGSGADYGEMDPLPHQIQSIHHITSQYDDIRFLLADEPGAGKTAVASSIIRDMRLDGRAGHTLVVVPAHLKGQWKFEMKRFAGLKGHIVDGGSVDQSDPWPIDDHDILITSIDYAKREKNRKTLARREFDLVVVDEAHHMNSSGRNVSTRYKLGETLSKISTNLLFLTATPHQGKPKNFQLLLKLLNPIQFEGDLTPEEVAARKDPMFMRHLKHDMIDMDGKPIFTKRTVQSRKYEMSMPEKHMYDMVSNYVRTQHRRLVSQGERLAPFVLLLIQKRMASSTYALQKTLERRREKLQDYLDSGVIQDDRQEVDSESGWDYDGDNYDGADPEHERLDDILSGISASRTPKELEAEIAELDELVKAANLAATTKPDKKLAKLRSIMNDLGDDKLLIFSEYVDTINYLEKNLGVSTCRIDGNMKQEQRDRAVQGFRDTFGVMLATDAAREGMNMQFCNVMVNYDLPWSPIVLEQRMGRLHRYGQKKDVMIHNMIAGDTIEGNVLERLSEKILEIQKQYSAVDVIGTILAEVNMKEIIVRSVTEGEATDIEDQAMRAREKLEWTKSMLEHTPVDLEAARRTKNEISEKHVDGVYLARMMQTVFEGLGGKIKSTTKKTTLHVPDKLRGGPFRRKQEQSDIPVEQLLARGTKHYKHVESWVVDNCMSDLRGGSVFAGNYTGYIVFHTTDLRDRSGKTAEVLVQAHHVTAEGLIQPIHPDMLYDLDEAGGDPGPKPDMGVVTEAALKDAEMKADKFNDEEKLYWKRRSEMMNIGEGLGRLRSELGDVRTGTPEWNKMNEKIERLESWEQDMQRRANTDKLHAEEPRMVGWVKVVRRKDVQDTEMRGMNRSMDIERRQGWTPEDVSSRRGIGYDILSRHPDGRERHIEVKAKCSLGAVQLTNNEDKARLHDPDFQLHIHEIDGEPHRTIVVENPDKMSAKRVTVWEIPRSEIDRHGVEYQW